jgi:hypothetical protein
MLEEANISVENFVISCDAKYRKFSYFSRNLTKAHFVIYKRGLKIKGYYAKPDEKSVACAPLSKIS